MAVLLVSMTSINAQTAMSKTQEIMRPTDCEEGRRNIDNAFYETREDPDAKLIFILRKGDGEADNILKDRSRYIGEFCKRRGFEEKCVTAIGMPAKGLGAVELFVVGKSYATFLLRNNYKSFCKNEANWDIY